MGGVRHRDGASSIQALLRNYGNPNHDVKGADQVKKSKVQSTEAQRSGGLTSSSDEVPVMGAERRRQVVLSSHVPTRQRRST